MALVVILLQIVRYNLAGQVSSTVAVTERPSCSTPGEGCRARIHIQHLAGLYRYGRWSYARVRSAGELQERTLIRGNVGAVPRDPILAVMNFMAAPGVQ